MKIVLAKSSGFCMGVRRAMEQALEALNQRPGRIYSYGPLIHNTQALDMLVGKGLRLFDQAAYQEENGIKDTVIIRAHGIPPQERRELETTGLSVIDATCPRVKGVQAIIKRHAEQGYTTLIFGDAAHPEVIGLLGHDPGNGTAVINETEVASLPEFEKVILVAQTTQSKTQFNKMADAVKQRWPDALVFDTICGATHRRQDEVRRLSGEVEAMIIVGGHNSGNTTRLAEVSESQGLKTIHLESEDELDPQWLAGINRVGITAGASTPNWMIKRIIRYVDRIGRKRETSVRVISYRILRILLLSNVFVALGAGAVCGAGALLQGITPTLGMLTVAFFFAHAMHMVNLFMDKEAGQYNDPDRAIFMESHKFLLFGSGIFSAVISLGLGYFLEPRIFYLLFFSGMLGMLYSVKIVPEFLRPYVKVSKFKEVPASKTFSVSLGWALTLTLIPNLAIPKWPDLSALLVAVVIFLLVFMRSALGGIFDIQGDRIAGQETVSTIIGEERTLKLLKWFSLILALVLAGGWILNIFPAVAIGLLILPGFAFFYLTLYKREGVVIGTFFEALVDTNFLLAGVMAWLWNFFDRL